MVYKYPVPTIAINLLPEDEDRVIELSRAYHIPKTSMARGLLRAGLAVFNQAPEEIVALADRRVKA